MPPHPNPLPRWGGGSARAHARLLLIALILTLGACAAPAPGKGPSTSSPGEAAAPRVNRTLVMAARAEIPSLASKPLRSFGFTSSTTTRLFNAGLSLRDGQGNFSPYLAEALPQLNTDTWTVSEDGHMQTTYRLRPDLVWHDGTALTADDFVFAYEVYSHPDLGLAASVPISQFEDVLAPDARTIVIRWRSPSPEAGNLESGTGGGQSLTSFPPLPRHVLDAPFHAGNMDAFIALPFWTTEYVGLGPYKIEHWDAGSSFEASAFDRHVLGKPKIERIRMLFIPDYNTSLANVLSGEAHITVDESIQFQQAVTLRREWEPRGAGTVLVYAGIWRHMYFQQRPEYAQPQAFRDPRIRKALMHSFDKQALGDALFEGESSLLTDTPIPPTSASFPAIDRAVTKYPSDPGRAEQLLADAGYSRGGDGVWAHPSTGRFAFELDTFQSPQNENEMHIVADAWRRAGFDPQEQVLAASLSSDAELRDTRPGIIATSTNPGEQTLAGHATSLLPTSQNRWQGVNRGGWQNAEFDRLAEQLNRTLARDERSDLLVQMARVFSDDAAVISLYFNPTVIAFVSNLKGPKPSVPEGSPSWDIHTWEWTS